MSGRGWVLALAVLATGCIDTSTVQCDGFTCPAGTICGADQRCLNPMQLTVCAGADDYTACSAPGVVAGQCVNQVCLSGGCGNAVLDPGELCDDGNTAPRDGCSSDCRSNETCGNMTIDVTVGES